ncbi:MAG: hypothetical protein GXP35_08190 [Actinobacteria bacterium]|nr:hypothetical protein [Actinomycetota bacterium]
MRTVIFDNEAVQSLASVTHNKHRAVLAHLEGVVSRRRRGRVVEAVVPTTVRVEAGWDRTQPAATLNRFRITDQALDTQSANTAATLIAKRVATSVADAHLGATVQQLATDDIIVITSDPQYITAVCSPTPVTIVAI